ncbi:hypothetical protein I316_00556 [Kwoniella heveanensis BCC8398]|uniref:Major facilitator superfamily (MFS) profile domain-containing protein n=1 Tax=Kwoniella heveanensis BCC8398 TaxID=1296120 RepID=A0A1B9H2D5_9TREE|nr:hypothetical protein I316_00556 [Kwoniella heveanensis BCC8398]
MALNPIDRSNNTLSVPEGPPPRVASEKTLCASPEYEKRQYISDGDAKKVAENEPEPEQEPIPRYGRDETYTGLAMGSTDEERSHDQCAPVHDEPSSVTEAEASSTVPAQDPETVAEQPKSRHFLEDKSSFFKIMFVTTTCATQLITQAQVGLVMIPLNNIGPWLGTDDAGEMSWMAASYGLTVGIFVVVSGRAGDVFGPKLAWTIGCIVVIAANIASGFCKTPIPFDICRAIAGIGSALSLPNALAILGRTYPPGHTRNVVFAILGALAPCGFVLGGSVAAIFVVLVSVEWVWWFVAIFAFAFLLLGLWVLPSDRITSPPNQPPISVRLKQFDYVGTLLLISAMGIFNFVWNQAPLVGWQTVYVYVLLIVSIACFAAFFLWERRVGKTALIPVEVLSKHSLLVYLTLWLGWMSFGTFLLYNILFIHNVRGHHSALTIAAQLIPLLPGGVTAALLVPTLIHRFPGHIIFLMAMVSFLIGPLFSALNKPDQTYWGLTFFGLLLSVFGPDLSFSTGQLIVSNSVAHEYQGIAAGVVSMITNYSLSIGLGFAGTAERYVSMPYPGASQAHILRGYRAAFWTATGLAALAIVVVALFVRMPRQTHGHEGKKIKEERAEEGSSS